MSNTLSVYDPLFYANEALIQLEKALGMAGRVHRGYDKAPQAKGSVISIRKPSTFTVADAPATAQDITASEVQVTLDNWREVKFKLTDKELSATQEDIINEHIRPMAYALADDIDQKLCSLYKYVPWNVTVSSPAAVADLTAAWRTMFNNRVPMDEVMLHMMLSGTVTEELMNLAAFSQWQGAGQQGIETMMRGGLGRKYGFGVFSNQNVQTHTAGVSADATGTLNGNHAIKATTVSVAAITTAGTVKAGDSFVIAGNDQRYTFTADGTAASGTLAATAISPPLVQAYSSGDVVTIDLAASSYEANLAFHRNAFCLAMAPLSDLGGQLGAKIATVADPKTSLALRSRLYYVGNSSEVHVALDVLFGFKTLDPNLAVRLRN